LNYVDIQAVTLSSFLQLSMTDNYAVSLK